MQLFLRGKLFIQVFGAPRTKVENLARIMHREKASAYDIVMIGDGDPDYAAAKYFGMFFIGVANAWNGWKEKEFPLVPHIICIPQAIKEHFAAHWGFYT